MAELHSNEISINILGHTYKIKCPSERITELYESAKFLEDKMYELSQDGKILGVDRLAVVVALNAIHELTLQKKQMTLFVDAMHERMGDLEAKVDAMLASEEEKTV